jgi:hypothetical protein
MPTLRTLPRTLAAVFAALALVAPTAAIAQSTDTPKGVYAAPAPPPSERVQDLRHLKAGNLHTSSLAGTTETNLGNPGPIYWSYDHQAPIPSEHATTADDGTPWMTIGLAIAAACFFIAAAAAVSARMHVRSHSERVAA